MTETIILANDGLDKSVSERLIRDFPASNYDENDGTIRIRTVQLVIFIAIAVCIYRKVCQIIDDFNEKLNRSEVVPGFPSRPRPHWLVGHLMVLRGVERQVKKTKKRKGDIQTVEEEEEETTQISTSFVRGYQRVYCDHADPETGLGSFWFFRIPCVSVLRGKDAKKIMCSSSFRKPLWIMNTHTKELLGQKSLLSLMNKEWRFYRTAVHKSFTSEVVKQSRPFIYQIGNALADSLLAKITQTELSRVIECESIGDDGSEDGTVPSSSPLPTLTEADMAGPISILPTMKMATIDVFGLVALRSNGVDFGCTRDLALSPIASAFDHLTAEYTSRLKRPWDPLSFFYSLPTKENEEFKRKRNTIRGFISEQITQTRARIAKTRNDKEHRDGEKEQTDMLTSLIKAADSERDKALPRNKLNSKDHNEALVDILMTLLFAGYDTTSIALTYALYLLAKNPTKKAKCLAEIDAVFGSDEYSGETNSKTIGATLPPGPEELPYTKAVILEAMRLFPPAPSTIRTMEKPITVGGAAGGGRGHTRISESDNHARLSATSSGNKNKILTLAKGQMVMLPIWSIQRSELNYPRPIDMIPERWVRRKRKLQSTHDDTNTENRSDKSETSLWEVRPEDDSHNKEDIMACNTEKDVAADADADDDFIQPANRDAFCTFAAGARNCVGKNLAVEESVILLACLVHKLSFRLVSDTYEVSPSLHSVVQQPVDDLPMIVRPRR